MNLPENSEDRTRVSKSHSKEALLTVGTSEHLSQREEGRVQVGWETDPVSFSLKFFWVEAPHPMCVKTHQKWKEKGLGSVENNRSGRRDGKKRKTR